MKTYTAAEIGRGKKRKAKAKKGPRQRGAPYADPGRFKFTLPDGGTIIGAVQGSGGVLRRNALARLEHYRDLARQGRELPIYEPVPGSVSVMPHYSGSDNGPRITVPLANVEIEEVGGSRAKGGAGGAKKFRKKKEPKNILHLGALNVQSKVVGEGVPPWPGTTEKVFKYKVVVSHSAFGKAARYVTDAWGSIHDHRLGLGEHNNASIGAMVVDELLSANADPDEFMSNVIGESPGMEALKRAKIAEKVIKAAKKFRFEELAKAMEAAEAMGLR